jgi:hypothetical protein
MIQPLSSTQMAHFHEFSSRKDRSSSAAFRAFEGPFRLIGAFEASEGLA